ncbi:MAG: hypothetical protein GY861_21795 [bacterium]|nr:hypothetical protein [bacterium]
MINNLSGVKKPLYGFLVYTGDFPSESVQCFGLEDESSLVVYMNSGRDVYVPNLKFSFCIVA